MRHHRNAANNDRVLFGLADRLVRRARHLARSLALIVTLLVISAVPAVAHTVSYGYVAGTQPGQYTFWFGTYHTSTAAGVSPVNYTEGNLQLTCGGGFSQTLSFGTQNNLVYTLPAGLVKGSNYFYDAGYGGEPGAPLFASTPTHTAGTLT